MIRFWIVMALLAVLIIMDMRTATVVYQKDRKIAPLILRVVLLLVLVLIVVNTILITLGADLETPYFNFYISKSHHLISRD